MAFPSYFQQLPNIKYSNGVNKAGIQKQIDIKDYFHLMRVSDDVYKYNTNYYTYTIINGERPEQVAVKEYGDESYYWIVLQVNDIVDPYSEWPLSDFEFEEYIITKYGSSQAAEQTRHYETVEVLDINDNIIQRGGLIVDEGYEFNYQFDPNVFVYLVSRPTPVSHYTYERRLNDAKSEIALLNKEFVFQMEDEFMTYGMAIRQASIHSNIDIAEYCQ